MRVLVTGAAGFVARHLVPELEAHGHEVFTTDLPAEVPAMPRYVARDLCDPDATTSLIETTRPEGCIHLAGVSFVPDGDRNPGRLLAINIGGTMNLLKAVRRHVPNARFLFVSTAQAYGCSTTPDAMQVTEASPIYPLSMYMISKGAGEQVVNAYGAYYGMDTVIARPANHTGPGQSPKFIVPSLVDQAKRIKRGDLKCFTAGNLESGRDFTDVRDVASAYRLILERGCRGGVYNVSAGQHIGIGELLALIKDEAGIEAPVEVNPEFVRPTDFSRVLDTTSLRYGLGWKPRFTLRDTIRDMLNG